MKLLNNLLILLVITSFGWLYAEGIKDREPLGAASQDSLLTVLTDSLETVESLQTAFRQKRSLKLFMEDIYSSGICLFSEPGLLRWEFTEPYKSLTVYNNSELSSFAWQENQWEKLDSPADAMMIEVMQQVLGWMKGDFSASEDLYEIEVYRIDGYIINLTPSSAELRKIINSIQLNIAPGLKLVRSVKIIETDENYIELRFSNEIYNPEFAAELFDLKAPALIDE